MPEPGQADPGLEAEARRNLMREVWLAAAACIRWIPSPRAKPDAPEGVHCCRALAYLPISGLIFGVALALCDRAANALVSSPGASAITIVLAVLSSGGLLQEGVARTVEALVSPPADDHARPTGWRGVIAATAMVAAEIFALGAIVSPPARARALVLAMLLSRWAIVPIGYGLKAREQTGLGIPYFGGITFSEFGISSVLALGIAMGLYDVVGLVAIIGVALTILGLRLLMSRRLGGVGGNALAAGAALCEVITLIVLAAISRA